jgi:hypothetical protein
METVSDERRTTAARGSQGDVHLSVPAGVRPTKAAHGHTRR